MKRLLLLLLLPCSLLYAETGYRITHPDGTVEFTDQPQSGGKEFELRRAPATTFVPVVPRSQDGHSSSSGSQFVQPQGYSEVVISSPQADETIWFDGTGVSVSVSVQPSLFAGHRVQIRMDGTVIGEGEATMFHIPEVYRGEHTLTAEIKDSFGTTLITSKPVLFHMRQHVKKKP